MRLPVDGCRVAVARRKSLVVVVTGAANDDDDDEGEEQLLFCLLEFKRLICLPLASLIERGESMVVINM